MGDFWVDGEGVNEKMGGGFGDLVEVGGGILVVLEVEDLDFIGGFGMLERVVEIV